MDLSASVTAVRSGAELSERAVVDWLHRRGFTHAHAALKAELSPETLAGEDAPAGQVFAGGNPQNMTTNALLSTPARLLSELCEGVVEGLSAYRDLTSKEDVIMLLERWDPQLCAFYNQRSAQRYEDERKSLEKQVQVAEEANVRLRTRVCESENQLQQTVAIVAERMQALASSVDPIQKDILLPMLRVVAVLGSSSTVRAAARHMMLTLYKRPMTEHRIAIVQEWLRVAQEAPPRVLEQVLIPELYTLVNAQVFERRLLALDCAAAVAPLLRRSPQVRYSLCQGLLRPLCEDDTSAVRSELPRCLALLWGDVMTTGTTVTQNSSASAVGATHSKFGGVRPPYTGAKCSTSTCTSDGCSHEISFVPLSQSQKTFLMGMLVQLATDSSSRTVRQAAQTQLCEAFYPLFLRDKVLLKQFVPLLLTVIEMEATQLLLLKGRDKKNGGAVISDNSTVSTATATREESGTDAPDEASASVAAALSLSNVITLIQLLHAALRCVAAELLHTHESETRHDGCDAGDGSQYASSLSSTYVREVLPKAYNLISPLLSKVYFTPLSAGGENSILSGSDASARLCGPLCALCATLASLVPLLGTQAWQEIVHYLQGVLVPTSPQGIKAALESDGASAMAEAHSSTIFLQSSQSPQSPLEASLSPQDLGRGRLRFVLSFFLFLCGETVTLPPGGRGANAPDDSTAPDEGKAATTSASPPSTAPLSEAVTPHHIQSQSLRLVAWCISLKNEDFGSTRSAPLVTCVQCVAALAPFAMESHEVASGISGLVRFLAASPEKRQRLTAVVLAQDSCAMLASEHLKVTLLIEPLVPLLEDSQANVQEAALSGFLSISTALTEPRAQEKTIRPVLRVADKTGCTSRYTRCLLQQMYQLTQRMPAEPREALLYPQLSVLMDRLAELYVMLLSQERFAQTAKSATSSVPTASATGQADVSHGGTGGEERDLAVHDWEDTMLLLQALLSNIIKCAVVTPTLVYRYLLPGIQQLTSDGVLLECSPVVRTRWLRLQKNYHVFMESNSSNRLAASGATSARRGASNVSSFLDRFKDELRRRL